MGGNRKRRSAEHSEGSDAGSNPAPSGGADIAAMRAMMVEVLRVEMAPFREEIQGIKTEVGSLSGRVSALEQRPASAPPVASVQLAPAAPSNQPAPAASSARAASVSPLAPSSVASVPTRLEFTNCHDYGRRMEEALDEAGALVFLRRIIASLPQHSQQCLLPERDQARRNSRALVFVPVLLVRPGLAPEARSSLLEAIRDQLSTGAHDRHGRRPRVRWELRPDQKPLSRLLGQAHRLTEQLATLHPTLARWKVQAAGKGVEFWLVRDASRPMLMGRIGEDGMLSNVASLDGVVTAAQIQTAWQNASS